MKFVRRDFDIGLVLEKPLMAHLSTIEQGNPRDSPVWFIWEESHIWIFGTDQDSFIKRLNKNPHCAVGIVDFHLQEGILRHVGIRGEASINEIDRERLHRFLSKYLGTNSNEWNNWFMKNIVKTLNTMVQVIPKSIVAKDVSFFKTGPVNSG